MHVRWTGRILLVDYANLTWGSPGPSASWVVPPAQNSSTWQRSPEWTLLPAWWPNSGGAADVDLRQYDQPLVRCGRSTEPRLQGLCGTGHGGYRGVLRLESQRDRKRPVYIDLKAANFVCHQTAGMIAPLPLSLFQHEGLGVSNAIDITLTALGLSAVTSGFGPTTIGGSAGLALAAGVRRFFSWGWHSGGIMVEAPSTTQARVEVTDASPVGTPA